METITLPHLPDSPIQVCLFKNVQNAAFLRQQLLEGNTDFEAISDSLNGRLKSRNVHSEIVFSLSPNNNIAESFRRFGIQDASTHVVAVKVLKNPEQSVAEHLANNVQGEPVAMTDEALASVKDDARIRKIYRLDQPKKGESAVLGKEAEAFVIGSMALKGA